MLVRLLKSYLAPYRPLLTGRGRAAVRRHDGDAVPAEPQRRHHRQRRRHRRHRLHPAHRRRSCSPSRCCRSCAASPRSTSASRTAMGFGRDLRGAIFHRVGSFSRPRGRQFGAPSLITRTTNDVQQVQMLVLMSCTMMVAAPIMMVGGIVMAMREDLGLSWLLAVCIPALFLAVGLVISRMVPGFRRHAGAHRRGQPDPARADHRHPRRPRVRPRAARDPALRRRPTTSSPPSRRDRPLDGDDVPARHADHERLDRRRLLVRRAPGRRRARWRSARSPRS